MPIRLLGDAVLRRRAWDLADQLGWASTYDAEYVALTQLQADALVTQDGELARRVAGIVALAFARRAALRLAAGHDEPGVPSRARRGDEVTASPRQRGVGQHALTR